MEEMIQKNQWKGRAVGLLCNCARLLQVKLTSFVYKLDMGMSKRKHSRIFLCYFLSQVKAGEESHFFPCWGVRIQAFISKLKFEISIRDRKWTEKDSWIRDWSSEEFRLGLASWKSINEKFTKPCDRCSPLGDAQIRELRLGKANLVKMKEEFGFAESGWNFNIIKCCWEAKKT